MSTLRRWSEDANVGRALIVAGSVIFVVQVVPRGVFRMLTHLWPVAIIVVGAALLLGRRR